MAGVYISADDQKIFDRLKSTGRITHALRKMLTQQWNKCISCGSAALGGRPVFAGFTAFEEPLLVGACCAHRLSELATPVYPTGTLDLSVRDNQSVWRYMDFAKFVALLQGGGLYFPRADTLDDRFEAAIGLASRQPDWDKFYLSYFREAVVSPPPGYPIPELSTEDIDARAKRLLAQLKAGSMMARSTLVSCWHANEGESEALWRLYCPPSTNGVAIRSDVGKLWGAMSNSTGATVGRVHYLDFRHAFAHGNERIFCKRASLSHENEVRIVLNNDRQSPVPGRSIACDVQALVCEVVISPFAPSWFSSVMTETINRFGYELEVRQSELLDEPFY